MGRARVPARREVVPEANGAFSSLIREGCGLRERSRGRGTRTRSLPALDPAPPLVVAVLIPKVWNDCFFVSPRLTGGNSKENLRKCSVPPMISIGPNITLINDPSGPLSLSI